MGRAPRNAIGGVVFHVLNRANARVRILSQDSDYEAFEHILEQARERFPVRILAYCLMPNHWHLVLWPEEGQDQALSSFMQWTTLTHTQRWHAYRHTTGLGHLYQGRFRSFPVQEDGHFLTVCRYVERNPLRAGLVERAEDWRWSSLWRRLSGLLGTKTLLADWPVTRPDDLVQWVNQPENAAELSALRDSVQRGRPFGEELWTAKAIDNLGLDVTMRPRGRPRKGA